MGFMCLGLVNESLLELADFLVSQVAYRLFNFNISESSWRIVTRTLSVDLIISQLSSVMFYGFRSI